LKYIFIVGKIRKGILDKPYFFDLGLYGTRILPLWCEKVKLDGTQILWI